MEDSYAHLQRGAVQSVSGTVDDTYEQIQLSVQPTEKPQIPPATTRTVKVILGLLGAVVLVALVVAVGAVVLNLQQHSELNIKISSMEQMINKQQSDLEKLTSSDLPLASPGISSKPTASSPATPVPTASTSATPVPTASSPATPVSPTDTSLTSCAAIHTSNPSASSGVYTIHIGGRVQGREVWCDMVTNGGGWTRFQRRQDGSVRFNRTWSEYKSGFGLAAAEFWLGNEDLHILTTAQPSELRVDLKDWDKAHRYAKYSTFSVGDQNTNYRLNISRYGGDAGDSLRYSNNRPFSTIDRDHDTTSFNCAAIGGGGGWWLGDCAYSNLNGRYYTGGLNNYEGLYWYDWRVYYSYKAASMMTRPRQ